MKSGTKSKPASRKTLNADLKSLCDFCRRMPHVTEDVKWGNDLVFSIGGKMFAVFDQSGGTRFSMKSTPGTFAVLTTRPGIIPAPYVARYHWISLEGPGILPKKEIEELIRESYHLISLALPARIRRQLAGESPTP
jgi:predicted DNA-binding protein (MmcQ/YjbR family)